MLALGTVVATSPDGRMVALAASLFTDALPEAVRVTAMRAQASILLGCDAAIRVDPTDATDRAYRMLARRLHSTFTARSRPMTPGRGPSRSSPTRTGCRRAR